MLIISDLVISGFQASFHFPAWKLAPPPAETKLHPFSITFSLKQNKTRNMYLGEGKACPCFHCNCNSSHMQQRALKITKYTWTDKKMEKKKKGWFASLKSSLVSYKNNFRGKNFRILLSSFFSLCMCCPSSCTTNPYTWLCIFIPNHIF